MRKLNLGCGLDIRQGWTNLDLIPLEGVDIVHDLNILPLPIDEQSFDFVLCQDVLEHVDDYIGLLREIWRILKKGGKAHIRVPHFSSASNFIDPTHKNMFSIRTFDFFLEGHERSYYFDFHFRRIIVAKIELFKKFLIFGKRLSFWLKWIESWINSQTKHQWLYEDTALVNIFPASSIIIEIEK